LALERKLTALLLIIAVAGSSFNKLVVMLDYQWNKTYIASTLCENRFKPGSCCQGKCYLKKQLQKDENNRNVPGSSKEKFNFDWFCIQDHEEDLLAATLVECSDEFKSNYYSTFPTPIFHPPA
jgi:hypothetical protein